MANKTKAQRSAERTPMVDPLDFMILDGLPAQGALVLGVYPDGRTAVQVMKEQFDGKVGTNILGPRFTALGVKRYVVSLGAVPGSNGKNVYQITPEGKQALAEWKAKRNGAQAGA